MSSTVTLGSMTVSSTSESADEMVTALTAKDEKEPKPKIISDKGAKVEEEPKEGLSKAASELGKKGAEAAAKARKAAEKEASRTRKEEPEEEPEPAKDEPEPEEDEGEAAKRKTDEEIQAAEPEKRKELASERVKEATRKAAAAERRAAKLEAELAAARQAPTQPPAPSQPAAAPPQGEQRRLTEKPIPQNYESYEEYLDDRDSWTRQETQREQERERFAQSYADGVTRHIDSFKNRVADEIDADESLAESVIPFEEVVRNSSHAVPDGQPYTAFHVVNDEILRARKPGRLMAYLNANPDEVRALLKLPTRDSIARKMERMQERLEGATSGTSPTKRAVSQAPHPVRPVTGSPRTADQELDENASMKEFARQFGQRELRANSR